ncbi:hypothetical protein OG205_04655 [Lentzea sp. NBC_00516]|uniref:hypothetical protein n=1 Tax=Lentzea sp. NBC_00516 TaxID=2903582 RepID=UPI002E808402|nr:hypothetical protein [Lentzea sp. NBC_00516]WUD26304.1 hypothetical protein OG205_04655 [Lentzea sp. NBC_00516]
MNLDDEPRELLVDVVLLNGTDDDRVVAVCGDRPVLLTSPDPLPERTLRELLDSRTTLTAHVGVPVEVVRALRETAVPHAFEQSPWLRQHRALVFVDGRCSVGDHVLAYDERIGVHAEEAL